MRHWTVQDRYGNEIYLTQERWEHILEKHDELTGRFDDLLDTLRYGRRRQETVDPQRYRYRRAYDDLLYGFNHIVTVVVFRYDASGAANNFVVTAWGAYIPSKG
ncbi:MAG TPA: hypothetical protein PL105_00230 [Caldilineaceae bacterium]|nr:hypothetical protein [Caldilineaceae bacterium]